ncbi:alpha-galactosidase [Mucilaginibacter yixingensis]|uniref:Alpha-galactosidase n=1 Tax=Mucilaginibacter yixingensis TaxID=1295612 RepID=A0A2T5JGF7_9SPHI|nr:glycoside hydrolase family 36 protein [Mucilaginibacter yixingensis]PTR01517.1 alpha-galactosidase [Mucilaginibacter yixingensis]
MHKIFLLLCCLSAIRAQAQEYQAGGYRFMIPDQQGVSVSADSSGLAPGLIRVKFRFEKNPISDILIKWSMPLQDITGCWTTDGNVPRFIHMGAKLEANLASQAPVWAFFNDAGRSRFTAALSDAFHKTTFSSGINEVDATLGCTLKIELSAAERSSPYEVSLLLNKSDERYEDALGKVTKWWADMPQYHPAAIPDAARQPLYSTWYSYHQNFDAKSLLAECVAAKKLGYTGIIVDDGWQTLHHAGGYAFTGDWQPERIPDMAGFVRQVHQTGMRCLLWYSVPFVGYKSAAFKRFEGKLLYRSDRQSAAILDPRYPDVRRFIVERYVNALKVWDLDGFKLDFIDSFTNQASEAPAVGSTADYQSVYAGIDALMVAIRKALTAVKPGILIEFRQSYTGPAMRKYGNMFRAGDCPAAALTNRIRTTDLRLLAGNTAVHSDMLTWDYHGSAPQAALQFLNIIFAVPQLSVRLNDIPASQLHMVRFYTRYWLDNRQVLLNGKFRAAGPAQNYPILSSELGDKLIASIYSNQSKPLQLHKNQVDLINAKTTAGILLQVDAEAHYKAEVYDCEGRRLRKTQLALKPGIVKVQVPPSGMICLRKF